MLSRIIITLGVTLLGLAVAFAEPASSETEKSRLERIFWGGIDALHIIFSSLGTLSGGADRGALWQFDIDTHNRSRIASGDSFAWPVQGADSQIIFALRGGQVVKVGVTNGHETGLGPEAPWRKLLGVGSDQTVFGLVEQAHGVQPAVLTYEGALSLLPPGDIAADEKRISLLLQEDRIYSENRRLVSTRSERGGRGFDVYYITDRERLNVSDCGDDACGQPALSLDERHVLYIRSAH